MEKNIIRNEYRIPPIGFGTWPLKGSELEVCMETAISVGYRLFDTADNYGNEDAIGNVITRNPQLRKELFIMTKISDEKSSNNRWSSIGKYFYKYSPFMQVHSCREVVDMLVEKSLKNLQTDYIDCLVMHWPYPDYMLDIWDEMIRLQEKGILRYIGVSNFRERHLEKIKQNFSVSPIVNQICVSPLDTKESLIDYCHKEGIQVLCYAPLQTIKKSIYSQDSRVIDITKKYGISLAELLLAWNSSQKIIPIVKSTNKDRMQKNMNALKIKLDLSDITTLSALNKNMQYLPESLFCPGC